MSLYISHGRVKQVLAIPFLCMGLSAVAWADPTIEESLVQQRGIDHRLTTLVVAGQEQSLVAEAPVTLRLMSAGLMQGSTGVNLYFARFTVDDQGGLSWGKPGFATTRKAGPEPLMNQERVFLAAIESTNRIRLSGGTIQFETGDGMTRLVFEPVGPEEALSGMYGQALTLTRLVLGSAEVKLPAGSRVTIVLGADGRVSGNSGINYYAGAYKLLQQGGIAFPGPFISTQMAGPPELMDLEDKFLAALAAVERIRPSNGGLALENAGGTAVLEFSRPGE
jgi:heat shock protein HslJ